MTAPVPISRTLFPMGDDMLEVRHTKALVTLLGRELLDAIKARSTQLSEPQEHGAPLPPTAEQASIARFNALADQIRELRDATKESFKDMNSDFKALFDYVTRNQAMLRDDVRQALKRLNHARPNVAVAKNKAAPLVGKKGTGRKG